MTATINTLVANLLFISVSVGSVYVATMAPFPIGTLLCIIIGAYSLGFVVDNLLLYR